MPKITYPLEMARLRVGHSYRIINLLEDHSFTVKKALNKNDYLLMSHLTYEEFKLSEIFQFGLGENFEMHDL